MSVINLIGKTPTVRLQKIEKYFGLTARLYAKLEKYNPSGSVKDRAAYYMVESAVRHGLIGDRTSVIEPTSGNMGISLAMLSSVYGYRAIVVMPESVSVERRALISAYGGEVLLTDGHKGMKGAIERAEQMLSEINGAYTLAQFTNQLNLIAHYETTGKEIYRDLMGGVDILVAGVGTGGTIGGAGRYLKEKKPSVKLIAVEPSESAVLSGGPFSPHGIQGIGAGFIPPLLDMSLIDRVMTVSTEESLETCNVLALKEGIFAGISSGAALSRGITLGLEAENEGKNIVVILPDGGEKYLSLTS
jgi:cysteine synthase A